MDFFKSKVSKEIYKNNCIFLSISLAIFSIYNLCINLEYKEKSFLYFYDLTHSFSLFIGSSLACLIGVKNISVYLESILKKINGFYLVLTIVLGIYGLTYLARTLTFEEKNTFLYGLLVTSIITAILIFSCRLLNEKTKNEREPFLLTFVNNISYLIYLFHWPLLIIFREIIKEFWMFIFCTIGVSIFISYLYYKYLEPLFLVPLSLIKKIVVSVIFFSLLGCSFFIVEKAPRISTLEKTIRYENIEQDIDNLDNTIINIKKDESLKKISLVEKKEKFLEKSSLEDSQDKEKIEKGILIIGDSITLGVRRYLLANIKDSTVNAAGSRSMKGALEVFKNYKEKKQLKEFVVLCIGTNALAGDDKILLQLIEELPKGYSLILMTPFDGRANEKWNSSKLTVFYRTLPQKYNFITIADWNKIASKNMEIYGKGDKVHFAGNLLGNELYTKCIKEAIAEAKNKPKK